MNNGKVIERVNNIFNEVINNKKDMYLYVASVLTGIDYDTLELDYDKNHSDKSCFAVKIREAVKHCMIGGCGVDNSEYLNFLVNPGITLSDCIIEKFSVVDEDWDRDNYSVFMYLFGYLRMFRFLNSGII